MKILAVYLVIFSILIMSSGTITAEPHVKVEVKDGPQGPVRPDLDTASVELTFNDVQNGSARIKLSSPEPKFFSPTDFPWVEGTELIDAILSIEGNKASFDYMFPIRGEYPMTVELSDENGNPVGTHQLVITIQENPQEIQNAIIFIALLGTFGLLVGFGLSKWRGNLMRLNVMGIGLMLLMIMMPSAVFADGSHGTNSGSQGDHARVGELAYFEGKFDHLGQGPFEVKFNAVKLEDGAQILALQSRSMDGTYKFGAQFFDGAEHEVTVQVIDPATGSILAEEKTVVEVEAFNPPALVKFKTMAFLLAVIAIGMVAGVGITRFGKTKRQWKGGNPRVA
jgi:hypothetical protein